MSKRLEILVSGTYHIVSGLILTPLMIKSGISVYGKARWDQLVREVALGVASKKLLKEVTNVVGSSFKPVFHFDGINMLDEDFGLEIFHGGNFMSVEMVDAAFDTPTPAQYIKTRKRGDILAVYHAQRSGALNLRWQDVDSFKEGAVCLHHVNAGTVLGSKGRLQLAINVDFRGKHGKRKVADAVTQLSGYGHVFHKVN